MHGVELRTDCPFHAVHPNASRLTPIPIHTYTRRGSGERPIAAYRFIVASYWSVWIAISVLGSGTYTARAFDVALSHFVDLLDTT